MQQSDSSHSTTPGAETTRRPGTRAAAAALVGAVVIVVLAGALRFEGLARDGLWHDETASREYARSSLIDSAHWHNGMALYHALMHVWIRIAGDSEVPLRSPSAVFGLATIPLLIVLVRRISGWATALLAALLLAVSWKHIFLSQEARAYGLFIMLSVLTTLLLVRLLERPGTWRLVAYGIALVALAYSHYQWVFVLVFHNLAVLCSRRRVGWGWLVLHVAVAAAYVPQIYLGIVKGLPGGWYPAYVPKFPTPVYAYWVVRDFIGMPPYLPVTGHLPAATAVNLAALFLIPVLAAAGLVACAQASFLRLGPRLRRALPTLSGYAAPAAAQSSSRHWGWLPVVWFGSVFVLPFLLAQTGKPLFHARYVSGTLPVWCWLIAGAITAFRSTAVRIGLVVVCAVCSVPAIETTKQFAMRPHWRPCVRTIEADERPGDVIAFFPPRDRASVLASYRGALPLTSIPWHPGPRPDTAQMLGLPGQAPPARVWVIVRAWSPVITRRFMRRPDLRLVARYDFPEYGISEYATATTLGPLPIILMLFEHVPPQETPPDDGQRVAPARVPPGGKRS